MAGRKGIITFEDLAFIRSCYQISYNIELLVSKQGETFRDHRPNCICLNEYMFKVRVYVPFEHGIAKLDYVFNVASIHITPNSWKIVQAVIQFSIHDLGPAMSQEEEDMLVRKEEADLQTTSREDARRSSMVVLSPETPREPRSANGACLGCERRG
ncbi:hypothetical protein ACLOJK_002720 [Asimina triloba]